MADRKTLKSDKQNIKSVKAVSAFASGTREDGQPRVYSNRHTWALVDETNGTATVGITDYLVERLGGIETVELPMVNDELDMEEPCIHLHAERRIHHLRSPLSGRVIEINDDVLNGPRLLHLNPYSNWLYRMELDDADEIEFLMDEAHYQRFINQL